MSSFLHRSTFSVPPRTLFDYHARPGAFERLNPPWQPVKVLHASGGIRDGAKVSIRVPILGPIGFTWDLAHQNFVDGVKFQDVQLRGPFSRWQHTHTINPHAGGSELVDEIDYKFPGGPIGDLVNALHFHGELKRLFNYRHTITRNDLEVIARYKTDRALKVLVSGASGLVGTALCAFLGVAGHSVVRLVRRPAKDQSEIFWDPDTGVLDANAVEGFDAWINLSGENVAGGRWTSAFKERLFSSRVNTTGLLARTIAALSRPPSVFVSASAIGIYGDRGSELLNENSPPGNDFLADVARRWEEEALAAESKTRVVLPRIGIVLSARGGALQKMLPPFLLGVGGRVGSGQQYMSWISLDDVVYGMYHAVMTSAVTGPVNFVTGEACTNTTFVKTLGSVLRRPTVFPLPAPIVRLVFGEMGERLLLGSLRVTGGKLKESGFTPAFSTLEAAFRHVVGRG